MGVRAVAFPDAEHVATRWLNSSTIGAPASTDLLGWHAPEPRIVITRVGGTPTLAIRIDRPRLDVDVYAPTKADAHDLAQAARVRLHELPTGDHRDLGAVVCNVVDELGLQWLPDPDTNTPRYVLTLAVTVRPHP
jgi:hypothetical protein